MSIVKDCCLIMSVLFMLIYYYKYCRIKGELISQRTYFINTLSHDFRVSLIAQVRGLEILQKIVSDEVLPFVHEINNSCKYSLDLVTILMNIYKLENGENSLNFEYIKLSDSITSILSKVTELANEKNIKFDIISCNNSIYADKESFIKTLEILIMTAIKYSKNGSYIKFDLNIINNKLNIDINRNGEQLSRAEYRKIFSFNYDFTTVGHSIQMYFCQKIIKLHNGIIKFKAGKYSTNIFKIHMSQKPLNLN